MRSGLWRGHCLTKSRSWEISSRFEGPDGLTVVSALALQKILPDLAPRPPDCHYLQSDPAVWDSKQEKPWHTVNSPKVESCAGRGDVDRMAMNNVVISPHASG
jgi:hypothetical protein